MQFPDSQWISAFTALVAVIVSPVVSLYVVRKQFGADVLSRNRQGWINTVRDHVAQILVQIELIHMSNELGDAGPDDTLERHERVKLLANRLKLLINPKEEDHSSLVKQIDEAIIVVGTGDSMGSVEGVMRREEEITAHTQKVLKREWERVKRGE